MSLIKTVDVKNHLSARYRNRIHIPPVDQPGTGVSEPNEVAADGKQVGFSKHLTADHRKTPAVIVPICDASGGT